MQPYPVSSVPTESFGRARGNDIVPVGNERDTVRGERGNVSFGDIVEFLSFQPPAVAEFIH